jgi:hypothetical protein
MTRTLWGVVLLFIIAQNVQAALYGWVSNRLGSEHSTASRILASFKDPVFLVSLILLSIATASLRLWLFPHAGVGRGRAVVCRVLAPVLGRAELYALPGRDHVRVRHLPRRPMSIDLLRSGLREPAGVSRALED